MLHRVQPGPAPAFAPNARLCISPEYLRALLAGFRAADIDVIGMDEALARVRSSQRTRRFVCFTFDDGYRDNLEHALPVFRRFRAPFTVYATTSFVERSLAPWWLALEQVIAREPELCWIAAGTRLRFAARSVAAKQRAFDQLSARFLGMTVAELSPTLDRFLREHGLSMQQLAEREICSWSELRSLQEAGVEIGCHAVSHARLSWEHAATARDELSRARSLLEAQLGQPVRHLAYPYGKREHVGPRELAIASELGFASAVTTRPGCLFAAHKAHRHALPRIEVSPAFSSSTHYLRAILTGLPILARNRGRLLVHD
jgi:peptidoglycan/xylan/chitin deacetylase (PgdA/CDA1 family)